MTALKSEITKTIHHSSAIGLVQVNNPKPEISVIIPLTDDRGQGMASIKSLVQEQSYPRDKFEVIVIANGSQPELERRVKALLAPQDSLIYHSSNNEFLLYDLGARRARSSLLFFTEAHCVADPDCLAEMRQYFATHPKDEARCRSVGVNTDENFLTQMEERMFEEAFGVALTEGHWLKVLVHGFAIYRDLYLEEGGFEYEFGQFAEWVLAARLHSRGRRLGYAPTPVVRHYYMGNMSELFLFIQDFTHGEISYRAKSPADYCERYFGRAPEWSARETYRAAPARSLCQAIIKNLPANSWPGNPVATVYTQAKFLLRFGVMALFGPHWPMFKARCALYFAWARIWFWRLDAERCYQAYHDYWQGVIRYCRLEFIADYLSASAPAWPETYQYDLAQIEEERLIGFHAVEAWQGQTFRWSEPVALVQVSLAKGSYEVRLQVLAIRPEKLPLSLSIFFDNQKIPAFSTDSSNGSISFQLDLAMFKAGVRQYHLVLVCNPLHPRKFGSTDRRELGLPISTIHFLSVD